MNKLYFDIETFPIFDKYTDDENLIPVWERFCDSRFESKEEYKDEINKYDLLWDNYSSLYPTFSKIICISMIIEDNNGDIEGITLSGEEDEILSSFNKHLDGIDYLIGHNIFQFDVPFVIRRCLVNGIKYNDLHTNLKVLGKKPWDLDYIIDTKTKLTFTSNFGGVMTPSLDMACYEAGIDTPKTDEVNGKSLVYYMKNGGTLEEIYEYCQRDVYATYELYNWLVQ